MAALNFQAWIVPKIEDGTKPGTIRRKRKQPIKIGDLLHLFTNMRNKNCRRIGLKVCYGKFDIRITRDSIFLDDCPLFESMKEGFAQLDGFRDYSHFLAFFETQYGLPFEGDWIVWNSKHVEGAKEFIQSRGFSNLRDTSFINPAAK